MTDRRLVLFDIDGTLVDVRGAGRRAFVDALQEACAIEDALCDVRFAGATDLGILDGIVRKHGRALDRLAFFDAMTAALGRRIAEEPSAAYPGVHDLLERLSADPRLRLGLVTGNAAACARLKLASVGLDRRFDLGAYGDEDADRQVLARRARARAEELYGPFARVFLVGDTPNDVLAARACGAVAVAVATGGFCAEALQEAGADLVVPTLEDGRVLQALLSA